MNKELLKRIIFVIFILGAGFSLEFFYYRNLSEMPKKDSKKPGTKRILLVGGSIIDSITPGLKSVLKHRRLSNFEILNMTYPMMSSDLASRMISEHLSLFQPDVVFLQVGMHERKISSVLALDRREKFLEFVLKKDSVGMNRYFVTLLEEILNGPEANEELGRLNTFLCMKDLSDLLSPSLLEPGLEMILSKEIKSAHMDEARLVKLFMIIENTLLVRGDFKSSAYSNFLKNFDAFLQDERSIIGKELFTPTDLIWRKKIAEMAGEKDIRTFLLESPQFLQAFGRRLYFFTHMEKMGRENVDSRVLQMLEGMKRSHRSIGMHGVGKSGKEIQFVENISVIQTLLNKNGIPLILLHYPNTEWEMISLAESQLNLKVIKNRSIFASVTPENYFKFFADRTGETGHLTIYGSEIYARTLIDQLPEIFNSSP